MMIVTRGTITRAQNSLEIAYPRAPIQTPFTTTASAIAAGGQAVRNISIALVSTTAGSFFSNHQPTLHRRTRERVTGTRFQVNVPCALGLLLKVDARFSVLEDGV